MYVSVQPDNAALFSSYRSVLYVQGAEEVMQIDLPHQQKIRI